MKPYSMDLRERVIAAVLAGELTQQQIANQFALHVRTVENWARQQRETGRIAPQPRQNGPDRTLGACHTAIRTLVKRQRDATLAELCDGVASRTGVRASPSMMCRELQIMQLPRKKKTLHDSQRDTSRVQRLRRGFKKKYVRHAEAGVSFEIY